MLIVHVQILVMFNQRELAVQGNDNSSNAYMEIDPRAGSTSRWEKRDYPLTEDRAVDLIGETIDGTLYNNSGDNIREWGLQINIAGDCFINQAWTGEMEIHQYVGTDREKTQRLNLQNYQLEDVELEYRYDGDLLIPLQQGDYLIYHPSRENNETSLDAGENLKIGMIFYYLGDLDLSDYTLSFHFHRSFTQGWSFIAFTVLAALWIISLVMYGTSLYIYRNAQKSLEMRKSGLLSMSELYKVIYIINLPTGEITPVSAGDYLEELRVKHSHAKELLQAAVSGEAAEAYRDAAAAFVDTDTLAERLRNTDSIACEFLGEHYGWASIRFFAMDRAEGSLPENVIFTVQDINDERTETQKITDRLAKAESASLANSSFLSVVSRDLQEPVRALLAMDRQLLEESDPEKMREHARGIRGMAERILLLIGGMADRAGMETGKLETARERYSLKQVISDVFRAVRPTAESRQVNLELEAAEAIPDVLEGDAARLEEVLSSLMSSAVGASGRGSVKLSVFGKAQGDSVHLLFSVRSCPENGEPSAKLPEKKTGAVMQNLDLEIAGNLLACMSSCLKTVQSSDAWQEMYFEIDQRIADPAPVGKITAEETKQ